MSINLRIIQEYYSKIQLKYNETVISLKQKNENDDHYIMFKDQFPEFNNLMLDFFNIIPSYYNFIDLKNLADKIKEKITGEESTIIKTFKELLIDINNINLMRDEIDKYLEEQQKKSIDTLKYIHNKLITEDLSPLSSSEKKNLLDNIINDMNNLTNTGISLFSVDNESQIINNETNEGETIIEGETNNNETPSTTTETIIESKEIDFSYYTNINIWNYYVEAGGKAEYTNQDNVTVQLAEYIGNNLAETPFDASITRRICDIINYLGWKYKIYNYNEIYNWNDKFIMIYKYIDSGNKPYKVSCYYYNGSPQLPSDYNENINANAKCIKIINEKNNNINNYSSYTTIEDSSGVPILPKNVYYDGFKSDLTGLENNLKYVAKTIINKGIDIERLRYYSKLESKNLADETTRSIIINAFYSWNNENYLEKIKGTYAKIGIEAKYYSYNGNEFKDKLVTTDTITKEELLTDVNPVDGKCCCYVANTGNVVTNEQIFNPITSEVKTTTTNILSGVDTSNNLLITSTYDQLSNNTLPTEITIQPFIYSVVNFGLIDGVNNKNDTIKDFYEEIIEGTNPTEPENPGSGEIPTEPENPNPENPNPENPNPENPNPENPNPENPNPENPGTGEGIDPVEPENPKPSGPSENIPSIKPVITDDISYGDNNYVITIDSEKVPIKDPTIIDTPEDLAVRIPIVYEPETLGQLPNYYSNVNSELYHYYYNKDLNDINNINLVNCDKHNKNIFEPKVLSLSYNKDIKYQISRDVYKKLINDNKYYNINDSYSNTEYIIGNEMDNTTLLDKVKTIKNTYLKNNKFSEELMLETFNKEIIDIYQSLPNGYSICINNFSNTSVLNNYYTMFVIDKDIDNKYFDGKLSYFNNCLLHILNPGTVRVSDLNLTKYDLSLFSNYNYNYILNNSLDFDFRYKILLLEIYYIKYQYNIWFDSIKGKLGISPYSYSYNYDKIRKLAESNGDKEKYYNMMDINYERTLNINDKNEYAFTSPFFKTYNIFKVYNNILDKWIELIKENITDYVDVDNIRDHNLFEDNDYINYFTNVITNIFKDDIYYYTICYTLDNIIPNKLNNIVAGKKANEYDYKYNICCLCYDNFIKFSVERFYKVIEKINILKKYYDTLGVLNEYDKDKYILNNTIVGINYLNTDDDFTNKYVYILKDNNNQYTKLKLEKDSRVYVSNDIITTTESDINNTYEVNMVYDNIITSGSIIDKKYINNLIIFKPRKLKYFLKNCFVGKTLLRLNKDLVKKENSEDYYININQLEMYKIDYNAKYELYKISIGKTTYDHALNVFTDNNKYERISEIPSDDNNWYTIIDDKFMNNLNIGHYLIPKNDNYKYILDENNPDSFSIISKIGLGPLIVMINSGTKVYKIGASYNQVTKKDNIVKHLILINDFMPLYEGDKNYIISNIKPYEFNNKIIGEPLDEDLEIYDCELRMVGVNYKIIKDNIQLKEDFTELDNTYNKFNNTFMAKDFNQLMLRKCFPDKFKNNLILDREVIENINSEKWFVPKSEIENALYSYGKYPKYLEQYFMSSRVDYKLNGTFNLRCIIQPTNLNETINTLFNETLHTNYEVIIQGKDMVIVNEKIRSSNGNIYLIGVEIENNKMIYVKPRIINNKAFINVLDFQQFDNKYSTISLITDDNYYITKLQHDKYGIMKNNKYITYKTFNLNN